MAIKAPKLRVTSYMRNVGRSFGYAVGDVVGEYAPVLKDIVQDTKSSIQSAKLSSGDMKTGIRDMINEYKTGLVTNTLDDLKSGNWYNKKRAEDAMNDMFGGDFDFDDDWGDFDNDDDIDVSPSDDTKDTRAIINSIDAIGENVSKNVAYSNARSAEYIVANQKASTRAMYELTGKGFNQVSGILMNMSDTMVGIASLGAPLTQHVQNSSVFYTQTTETLNSINESITKLVERTAFMDDLNKKVGSNRKKNSLADVFIGGDFSLSSYIDMVKENTKDQVELIKGLKDTLEMMGGKGGKNTSLAQFLPKTLINTVMPNFFKATLKQFSESINNALISGMVRGGRAASRSSNPIINMLGDILFPKLETKTKINTGKYDRGPMQWDGEAKKALTYVIPNYLAKIYASLSGDEKYFDYETGKYTSVSMVKKKRNDMIQGEVSTAGGEFRNQARRLAKGNKNVQKQIDNFIRNAIMNDNGEFNFYELEKLSRGDKQVYKQALKEFGIDERTANVLIQTIRMANNPAFGNKYRNMASNFERDIYGAKGRISQKYSDLEAKGNSIESLLEDSFITGGSYTITISGNGKGGRSGRNKVGGARLQSAVSKRQPKITENADGTYTVDNITLESQDYYKYQNLKGKDKEDFLRKKKLEYSGKTVKEKAKGIGKKIIGIDDAPADSDILEAGGAAGTASDQKSRFKRIMAGVKYYWQKPFAYVSMALDNLTRGINELFWGVDGNDGIIQKISDKLKDTWENVKKKWDEIFPKDGKGKSLKEAINEEWTNAKQAVKNTIFGGAYATASDKARSLKNSMNAFSDKYAEMVQNGTLDKFGKEAGTGSGLLAGGESKLTFLGKSEEGIRYWTNEAGQIFVKQGKKFVKAKINKDKERIAQIGNLYKDRLTESSKEVWGSVKNSKPAQAIGEGASLLGHGLTDFFGKVIYGDKDIEEQKKNIFDNLGKTMKDLAPAKGAIGLGAIGGVGVSLLTGALVGPIAGAAIGAGVGLATKSQAFQDFLFGKGDPESNEYTEGLLGGFGKALKADGFKSAKSVGTGSAIGAGTGLLLGSPIVGAIVGGAAGYVSSSQKAQEFLFGTADEKTWLGEVKDKIKSHMPNMTAGMIAGLVAGPFGVAGNLALGAALGYASTSDKFKNFMFGDPNDKNDKGLAGKIHDRIMNPLNDIMHNIANVAKNWSKRLFKSLGNTLLGWGKSLGGFLGNTKLGKGFKNLGQKAGSLVSGAVGLAGDVLGAPNKALTKAALQSGADVYSSRLGRNLTFAERSEQRRLMRNGNVEEITDENGNVIGYQKVDLFSGKRKDISAEQAARLKERAGRAGWKENSKAGAFEDIMAQMSQEGNLKDLNLKDMDSVRGAIAKFGAEKGFDESSIEKALKFTKNEISTKDLILTELKLQEKISKEEQEKQDEYYSDQEKFNKEIADHLYHGPESIKEKVINISKDIKDMVQIFSGKTVGKAKELGTGLVDSLAGEGSRFHKRLRLFSGGASDDNETRTEFDMFGNPHQYQRSNQGEWIEQTSDKETVKSRKIMDKFSSSLESLPLIGTVLSGFKGLKRIFGGDDEEGKKEKKGLLDRIADFLNPDSPTSGWAGLGSLLTKGKSFLAGVGGWAGLGMMAGSVLGFSGQLNSTVNRLVKGLDKDDNATSHGRMNSGSLTLTLQDGSKVEAQIDPVTGLPVRDDNGNYIGYDGSSISEDQVADYSKTQNKSLSHQLGHNAVVQGAKTLAKGGTIKEAAKAGVGAKTFLKGKELVKKAAKTKGNAFNKVATIGKNAKNSAKKVTDFAKKSGSKLLDSKLGQKVLGALEAVGGALKKVLKKFKVNAAADKIDNLVKEIAEKITSKLSNVGAKAAAGFTDAIPVIGQAIWVADLVVTATNAWGDAENILGIIEEPTLGEKVIATLIATINEAIPFVGGLIPHDVMASLIIGAIEATGLLQALGWDGGLQALRQKQETARQTVDQYNQENGTDYTIEEYNINVNEDVKAGWWTRTKHWAGKATDTVKEGVVNTAKGAWEGAKNLASNAWNFVTGGSSGLIKKVPSHSLSTGFKHSNTIKPTMISGGASEIQGQNNPVNGIFNAVFDNFNSSNMLSGIGLNKEDMKSFTNQIKKMSEAAQNGDLTAISDGTLKLSANMQKSPLSKFFNIGFDMAKSFNSMGGVFGNILKPVSEVTGEVTDESVSIGDRFKNIAKSTWDNIKEAASSFWSSIFPGKNDNTSTTTTTETSDKAASGSGFVSQFDPRYQNYKVSGANFANKGCGPAVAAMTASALGRNLSVGSAVNASHGYQVGNGVTLDYFQRALGSQGINTEYIAGGGAGDIYNSIASGKKVILLGQDASNTSKSYSPFGPNNHYVVATGLDRSGNVVVNDPELNGPTTYSPGILNSVKYGVAAGRSGIRRKSILRRRMPRSASKVIRRYAGGSSYDNANAKTVWTFLRNNNFSEHATAAIMGNLYAESGMNPTAIQGKGKGPAAGLCQWENYTKREGRWLNLYNYAKSVGKDWTDLVTQLEFMLSEIQTKDIDSRMQGKTAPSNLTKAGLSEKDGVSFETFRTSITDIAKATRLFEAAFERAGKPHMDRRIEAAKNYYELYTGQLYQDAVDSAATATKSADGTTQTQSETQSDQLQTQEEEPEKIGLLGALGKISSIFSDAFTGAFNKTSDQSEEEDETGETGDTSMSSSTTSSTANTVSNIAEIAKQKITQIPGGKAQSHPSGNKDAQSVVDIARSQLGVTEAGENITDYGKFTGTDGQPWCAAFTSWVFDKAFGGDMAARNKALHGGISASVSTLLNQFDKDHAVKDYPEPGDLVIYKNGTSHVGIVEGVDGNTVYTIEGNTSGDSGFDRNGGVVYRKSFDYTNRSSGKGAKLTGFGRPIWPSEVESASGSGLLSYNQLSNRTGGSSGILMRSRAGSRNGAPSVIDPKTGRMIPFSRFAGGATNIADASRNMLQEVAQSSNNNRGNGVSPELVAQLLSAITTILNNIADNTAPVNKIYQALVAYLESGGSSGVKSEPIKINKSKKVAANGGDGEIDPKLKSLVSTLAQLAKG